MSRYQCIFLSLIYACNLLSQTGYNGSGLRYPLDKEPVLTGNYGEIRPNHFHAGIDFVTDPTLNLPIYAVADGYISRIKISPVGYGKVLYVTHANGTVSVYAHEHHFCWKVNKYVTQKQTEQQKNEIELFPGAGELPVKKGELIGYTGNTGGSTGPHLHFEIRDEKTEIPLNPLLLYDIADTVKPQVTHMALYRFADTMFLPAPKLIPVKSKTSKQDSLLIDEHLFALGFVGFDKENKGLNPNAVYGAKVFFDQVLVYNHELDHISFENGKFVNAFSEKQTHLKVQRCFAPQCYDIPIYKTLVNRGIIGLRDTNWHRLTLIVYDEKRNESTLIRYIRSTLKSKPLVNLGQPLQYCNREFNYQSELIKLKAPAGFLYNAAPIKVNGSTIGEKTDFLQKPVSVKLKIPGFKPELATKYVLLVNGNPLAARLENDWLVADSRSLGNFSVAIDTIKPTIKPVLTKQKLANLAKVNSVSFKIKDNLGGINHYDVYINNTWQIAEYDAKADLLTCYFTETTPVGQIEIKIVVDDPSGNKNELLVHTKRL